MIVGCDPPGGGPPSLASVGQDVPAERENGAEDDRHAALATGGRVVGGGGASGAGGVRG